MSLIIVILILAVWGIIGLKNLIEPPMPPIKDMDAHLRKLQSLPDVKSRQKYLKDLRWGRIKE